MENTELLKTVKQKAQAWLTGNYDKETKETIKTLLENNETELVECFYRDLAFGTGGLRGIMGVGTNRINIYTVGMATQGLANYVKKEFKNKTDIKVAIAHDCRNNSRLFAEKTAQIFAGNGFQVYLFESLRPTPELSFAIRHFGCQTGVMITASHNPKEYNGYKVYWEDGGQIIAPHDKNIIAEVQQIKDIEEVQWNGDKQLVKLIGDEIDEIYTDKIKELSLAPEIIAKQSDLKIVYTPIHGTGVKLVPMALKKAGFKNIYNVPEQDVVDGNFPTVHSPNPEEKAALNLAIEKGKSLDADIIMGTDPDADRVGIVVKNNEGEYVILNGNQTAAVLINYLLKQWNDKGKLRGKEYIVKTIVTTDLLFDIADKYKVGKFNVLTGFKYIADIIKQQEGQQVFIGGGEESYGYLAGEFVRDKDAVISCALIAEVAAYAKDQGKTLFDFLLDIYQEFAFYKEDLISVVREGKSGAEDIQAMMKKFRENPPSSINRSEVVEIKDYLTRQHKNMKNGSTGAIDLPQSDVLQFFLEDGSKISVRPSGTEPKIKFYFGVKGKLPEKSQYNKVNKELDQKIQAIIDDLID